MSSRFAVAAKKVQFISLGCPRNLVDTEVMIGLLMRAGYEVTPDMEDADFIVVNTCGFLKEARDESRSVIADAVAERQEHAKVIVTGCMVNLDPQQFPEVDYVLGSGDVEGIVAAIQSTDRGEQLGQARSYLEAGEVPRTLSTPQHYAYLKIAEGCRKRCAYCIIPDIKGPLRSKPPEQVEKEFQTLLRQGVKEVILIAQDLGDYGKDHGQRQALVPLLQRLLKQPGDYWIRLLYLYPDEITDELIELMKNEKRLCPYLDMPIQHIDDDILKAMRRKTNAAQIKDVITKLRKALPEASIRSSLIVGFPGETPEQFEKLKSFLQAYPLDNVGVFKYSQEEGSHAATLPNQVSQEVKDERHAALMNLQASLVEQRLAAMVGKRLTMVVEGYHPDSELLMVARHRGQCPDIDGHVIINDAAHVDAFGERYEVEVTAVAGYDLVGRTLRKLGSKLPLLAS